jgi:hypothetical protein
MFALMPASQITLLRRGVLAAIAVAYSLLVVLYAVNVPRWNAPDEPAHFNYVRHLAERVELPVLLPGDYDFAYLERLKAERFPPALSIDGVRYEAHQPPLYYLVAAVFYRLASPLGFDGQFLVLRLFSGLLGLLLLFVAHATVRRIFPEDLTLSLAVPAFIAFTPMHLAVNAAIGNDPAANLILAVVLWEALGLLRMSAPVPGPLSPIGPRSRFHLVGPYWRLGLWLGLALLVKTTAYVGLLVAAAAVLVFARRHYPLSQRLLRLTAVYAIAICLSGWWFLRNALVYGIGDPFGLQRHALVVAGQPLTGAVDLATLQRFAATTFQSFWGQFGWMGVLMDQRVYTVLASLSLAAALGLGMYLLALARAHHPITPAQGAALQLLLLTFLLVAAAMAHYSFTSFFQPQARYLFPALVPIATGFLLGLQTLARPSRAPLLLGAFLLSLLMLAFFALYSYIVPSLRS